MTKLTHKAAGTFAIAPTPFHDDGRIDEKSIDRLTDFYGEVGCDGVTVLGILGEAPKLEASEAELVAKRFVKRAGKMQNNPIVGKLVVMVAPKYKDRTGGYTRITKMERRQSDGSKMATIELI